MDRKRGWEGQKQTPSSQAGEEGVGGIRHAFVHRLRVIAPLVFLAVPVQIVAAPVAGDHIGIVNIDRHIDEDSRGRRNIDVASLDIGRQDTDVESKRRDQYIDRGPPRNVVGIAVVVEGKVSCFGDERACIKRSGGYSAPGCAVDPHILYGLHEDAVDWSDAPRNYDRQEEAARRLRRD